MYYTKFETPLCEILLAGDENGLQIIHMNTGEGKRHVDVGKGWTRNDDFFENVKKQLLEYVGGKRKVFDVKLNPQGTAYQKSVWNELVKIPYGEVRTYKELAIALGNPNGSRAVGTANGKNPIPIIIPCHRVVGSNGALTGFAHGINAKASLLNLEKKMK